MVDPHWGPVAKEPAPAGQPKRLSVRILKTIGLVIALGLVAGVAVVFVGYTTTKLPNPNKDFTTATSYVYYGDGKAELGSFAVQNREPLEFKQMPDSIKEAMVAAENRTFWTDKGISLRGMARAAWVIARGGSLQGGSTITQQYIKILYLTSDQTATRKFKELFLAYKINREKSKEDILEGYLNTIYYGHGAYGIQAASQAFFGIDAKKLSVQQAAVLASVVNNPTAFDPADDDNHDRLLDRYQYVLRSMQEMGNISDADYAKWSPKLPKFPKVKTNERYGGPKGFLLKMVESELSKAGFSSSQISGGGLKITTTFDKDAQNAAVEAAQKYTKQSAEASGEKAKNLHAAIASVDVKTGGVVALYGGPDYTDNSRNWATTARPTASTFKTYALAAGLKDGSSLLSTYQGNSFYLPGDEQVPRNIVRNEYSFQYGSQVNLIKATTDSINTAFVDLVTSMDDGKDKVLEVAEAAGAPKTRGWDAAPRNIPIGTPEVSPLNQASGYATFANNGVHVDNHVVKEVRDENDQVIYKANPEEDRAVSEDVADDVTYALSNVVENGTGRSVQTLNRPVAGKTGTNGVEVDGENIVNSSWFVGYTKQISTAVMYVAGDSGSASLDDYRRPGDSTFFGGTYPASTWGDYMAVATEGQDVERFDPPAYVNRDKVQSNPYTQPQTQAPQPSATQQPSDTPSSQPSESGQPTDEPSPSSTPTRTASAKPSSSASKGGQTPGGATPGTGGG